MRITTSPEALPGSCGKCGSASREFYVDTDLYFEFHGALFFCCDCAGEIARLIGYISEESVKELRLRIESLETDRYNLQRQVDGLEKAVDGFTMARSGGRGFSNSSDINDTDSTLPAQRVFTQGESMGTRAGKAPEPSNDKGMAKLPDDESKPGESVFNLGL